MKKSEITWTQLWTEFEKIWSDSNMLKAFGPDRQTQLLRLTGQELFKRSETNELVRQALIDFDNGMYFDM